MGNFRDNRGGGRSGGGRSFGGGRSSYGGRSSERPTMHQTICSKCGKSCEVPFKPTGEKPVFCRDCFRDAGGPDMRRSEGNFAKPRFDNRNDSGRSAEVPQYKEQFESLNFKLDKILRLLSQEKAVETQNAEVLPQEEEVLTAESVEPIKKKARAKKVVHFEDTVEAPTVSEVSAQTEIPTEVAPENPTE